MHAIREGMLVEAAESGTDLIFTTVYAGESSEPQSHPQARRGPAQRRSRIHPVRLTCDRAIMEDRVANPRRRDLGKLNSVEGLRNAWAREEDDLGAVIPDVESLLLDTASLKPAESAIKIIEPVD